MGTGHHKTGFFILYFSEDLSESWGCRGRSWMIFHPLFFYLGWIWKSKIEVTTSRPESESSENVRLHKCERALVQANPVPTFPLDFKPACDINTRRRHCSICWLRLEFKALALTCEMWNVLESLAWDIISFLCHVAIHEITRDARCEPDIHWEPGSAKVFRSGISPLSSCPTPSNFHPIYKACQEGCELRHICVFCRIFNFFTCWFLTGRWGTY